MTVQTSFSDLQNRPPRARGQVRIGISLRDGQSRLSRLYQSGSLKVLFPRNAGLQAVLVNTAGGITGGDSFSTEVDIGPDCEFTMTTQAAERAYRAAGAECGAVSTRIRVGKGARFGWLPQETILFDRCALSRRLRIELEDDAQLTLVEPLVFGRKAMGEQVRQGLISDRIDIRRDGRPLYFDTIRLEGNIDRHLARPGVADGAAAIATLLHLSPTAESQLASIRNALPPTAGASLMGPDLLVLRAVANDGFDLRRCLMPILTQLTGTALPRPWMI